MLAWSLKAEDRHNLNSTRKSNILQATVKPYYSYLGEVCTDKNNYYQNEFAELMDPFIYNYVERSFHKSNRFQMLPCMAVAMKGFKPNVVRCVTGKDNKKEVVDMGRNPPCVSTDYFYRTAFVFARASSCFAVNPRTMFKIFNHESRFHFNAIGPSGDVGIGQMVPILAKDVNIRLWERISKNECSFVREYNIQKVDLGNKCDIISAEPKNQARQISYAAAYLEYLSERADLLFKRWFNKIASLDGTTAAQKNSMLANKEKIVEMLVMASYHGGEGRPKRIWEEMIAENIYFKNFASIEDKFQEKLNRDPKMQSMARYLDRARNDLADLEKKVGKPCL